MAAHPVVSISPELIKRFATFGIEVSFLIPTTTGLEKSILDATAPVREFLRRKGIHDFAKQGLGQEHKRHLDAELVTTSSTIRSTVSLYRPQTKNGDPRIWISKLPQYARPMDVLAVAWHSGRFYVINSSDAELLDTISDPSTPLGKLAANLSSALSSPSKELPDKLKLISKMGFVRSAREGSTGVGATLEALLGIEANSSKKPDFKGIEIKASRQLPKQKRAKNRVNLFSQVPDWKNSPIGTASNLLGQFGYVENGRRQLYCSLSAQKVNTQGLKLVVDQEDGSIKLIGIKDEQEKALAIWDFDELMGRLSEKHPESFWVKAEAKKIDGTEHFRYYHVVHTVSPIVTNLPYLVADGTVTLDLTMSEKGKGVRDHGYLFKIWPSALEAIFPAPREYSIETP